nr:hypothetical protein [Streptomyces sp. C8S0]
MRLIVARERSFATGRCCCGVLDGLQDGEHPAGGGIARVGGLLHLVHGAVDALEPGGVNGELAAGQAVEEREVERDADLGPGQLAVLVDQVGVRFVENTAVAKGPQRVDVMTGDGFDAVVERRNRTPVCWRRGSGA